MNVGTLEVQMSANIARLQSDMAAARRTVEDGVSGISRAADAAKAALASLGLGAGLAQIIQMSDQYAKFTAQLKLATQSTREYGIAMADVKRIATAAQADLSATGVLYARIANGTRELGVSQARVAAITESVNLALKVSGATGAESASAMLQLSQAFASGALRGEEFNAINEAAPRLMKALADGMGVPVGALKQMASDGKITSEIMAQVLPKALAELRKEADSVQTISGAFAVLKNNVMQFVGTSAEANGMVTALTTGIGLLANNLTLVAGALLTVAAVKIGTGLADMAARAYETVAANRALVASNLATAQTQVAATGAASTLAAARVVELRAAVAAAQGPVALAITTNGLIPAQARAAVAAEAHTAALAAQAVAMRAASTAAGFLRGALAVLGGPIGAIITLLGLGATAWTLWGNKSKEAEDKAKGAVEESTKEMIGRLDKQIAKLKERNALIGAVPEVKDASEADKDGIAKAKRELDAVRAGAGEYAKMSPGARAITEIDKAADYAKALANVKTVQNEVKIATEATEAVKLEKWFGENGTKAQQFEYALKNLKKEFKVVTPEMEAALREKYKDTSGASAVNANNKATLGASLENIKYAIDVEKAMRVEGVAKVAELHRQGLATDAQYYAARRAAALEAGTDVARVKEAEIAELAKYHNKDKAEQTATNGKIARLNQEKNEALRASLVAADALRTQYLYDAGKPAREAQAAADAEIDAVNKQAVALQAQYESYNKLPEAITEATIAKLQAKGASLEMNEGTEAEIANNNRLIVALQARAKWEAQVSAQDRSSDLKYATELLAVMVELDNAAKNAAQGMASSFGQVGAAIGGMTTALTGFSRTQAAIAAQLIASTKEAKGDPSKIYQAQTQAANQMAQAQIGAYANMAGAAKGFFSEHSKGYAVMQAAEKTFRAIEMAMAIEAWVKKTFFSTAVVATEVTGAGVKVGAQAAATTASVGLAATEASAWGVTAVVKAIASLPFPLNLAAGAATLAAVVGIGASIAGSIGGGATARDPAKDRQDRAGTQAQGMVGGASQIGFYDWELTKSDAIAKAMEILKENSNIGLRLTNSMLSNLQSIKDGIGGMASFISQAAGMRGTRMDTQNLGLGSERSFLGFSSSKTTLEDTGLLVAAGQTIGSVIAQGLKASAFQDIKNQSSSFFGVFKSSSEHTNLNPVEEALTQKFSSIITSMADTVADAATFLGGSADEIRTKLNAMGVDLGKISFKGLSADEIQKELEAVFGKLGDDMARMVMPGVAQFNKAGEDYLATLVRVSSGLEQAQAALDEFGLTAVSLSALVNKTGDITAEIIRQTITESESTWYRLSSWGGGSSTSVQVMTEVGKIIDQLPGDASDLVEAYRELVAIRYQMKSIGLNEAGLTMEAIKGAGGLDKLAQGVSDYLDSFFTGAEQNAAKASQLTDQLRAMGVSLPRTKDDFVELVSSINMTTLSGQKLYGQLMAISGEFADVADAVGYVIPELIKLRGAITSEAPKSEPDTLVDQAKQWLDIRNSMSDLRDTVAKAIYDQKKAALESLSTTGLTLDQLAKQKSLQQDLAKMRAEQEKNSAARIADLWAALDSDSITAEQQLDLASQLKEEILDRYAAEKESTKDLLNFAKKLREYVQDLRLTDLSPMTNAQKLQEASSQYASTLAMANAGDTEAMDALQGKAGEYLKLAREFYASSEAYKSIFDAVTSQLDAAAAAAEGQAKPATADEQQVAELQKLQDFLNQATATANTKYDQISTTLANQLLALQRMEAAYGVQSTVPEILRGLPAEIAAHLIAVGVRSAVPATATAPAVAAPLAASTYAPTASSTSLPSFFGVSFGRSDALVNGSHANGLSNVPFDGYIAELHKDERVLTASENKAYSGQEANQNANAALVAEIRSLKEEVSQLRREQSAQTGALIAANYDASDRAAGKVVQGTHEAADNAAWKQNSKAALV
jgi:tape measure domain-containing protein